MRSFLRSFENFSFTKLAIFRENPRFLFEMYRRNLRFFTGFCMKFALFHAFLTTFCPFFTILVFFTTFALFSRSFDEHGEFFAILRWNFCVLCDLLIEFKCFQNFLTKFAFFFLSSEDLLSFYTTKAYFYAIFCELL